MRLEPAESKPARESQGEPINSTILPKSEAPIGDELLNLSKAEYAITDNIVVYDHPLSAHQ